MTKENIELKHFRNYKYLIDNMFQNDITKQLEVYINLSQFFKEKLQLTTNNKKLYNLYKRTMKYFMNNILKKEIFNLPSTINYSSSILNVTEIIDSILKYTEENLKKFNLSLYLKIHEKQLFEKKLLKIKERLNNKNEKPVQFQTILGIMYIPKLIEESKSKNIGSRLYLELVNGNFYQIGNYIYGWGTEKIIIEYLKYRYKNVFKILDEAEDYQIQKLINKEKEIENFEKNIIKNKLINKNTFIQFYPKIKKAKREKNINKLFELYNTMYLKTFGNKYLNDFPTIDIVGEDYEQNYVRIECKTRIKNTFKINSKFIKNVEKNILYDKKYKTKTYYYFIFVNETSFEELMIETQLLKNILEKKNINELTVKDVKNIKNEILKPVINTTNIML